MDRMTALETFVSAVETGSFNRAGQRRHISQSAVSQQIAALEQLLEQELVIRSPKGIRMTEAGQVVFRHAQDIMRNYSSMSDDIAALRQTVAGTVRVSVGSYLGKLFVGPALIDLNARYPELDLVIRLEDRLVDVVAENYDLAVRTGALGDTPGYARKLATIETALFATPAYLARHGTPQRPADLEAMKFVQFNESATATQLTLNGPDGPHQVTVPVALSATSPDLIIRAVLNGTGFSRAPLAMVEELLAQGALVQLLPDYPAPPKDIHLIYPSRHALTRPVETVITALHGALQDHPSITPLRTSMQA